MRQKIAELKKEIILEVAARFFQEHGFEATAVSQIAKEAEVSIGTIYGFFESKDGLFMAVHEQKIRAAFEYLQETYTRESDPITKLKSTLNFYFTEVTTHKKSVQELLLSMPIQIGCPPITKVEGEDGADPKLAIYELVAKEFAKIHKETPLCTTDFLQLSFNFRNLAFAYIERWAMLEDIVLIDKVDECLEMFLKGIRL